MKRHPVVLVSALILIVSIEFIVLFFSKSIDGDVPFSNLSFDKEAVMVYNLKEGDTISSPMIITGQAKGPWFFEGVLPIVVVDWDGLIIGEGYVQATSDWMIEGYVSFEGLVSFTSPANNVSGTYSNKGAIIFKKNNPSGLPENDAAIEIPVVFK
ncbi:MAG: Gmad2 immunoglobulin-like domain-containing protein [Candidatus Paceibacterota bacterium]|jgi:hypothetical protein